MNLTRLYQVFLVASYLYYVRDESPIPDSVFDEVCRYLLDGWNDFDHPHKHLISKSDLKAGTGFAIKFPMRVVQAGEQWIADGRPPIVVYDEV